MKSFHELETCHEDLERQFQAHQVHLVENRIWDSLRELHRFRQALEWHAADEEALLFPVFAQRVERVKGGDVEVFRGEHRKILLDLALVQEAVEALHVDPTSAGLISVIEREMRFKSLLAHHFLREHNVLFPALDAAISDETERAAILSGVTAGELFGRGSP